MEVKLLKIIINPSMIISIISGSLLAYVYGFASLGKWFHIKIAFVIFLVIFHIFLAKWRKNFARGANKYSEKFYRYVNEIPPIAMIVIVVMVIMKPFE
jgi:putative membrane protein